MFYEKITELSAKKGMSVARMAQELGLSNATATKWRHGAKPYYNTLIKIAKYFDVDVEFLVDDDADIVVRSFGEIPLLVCRNTLGGVSVRCSDGHIATELVLGCPRIVNGQQVTSVVIGSPSATTIR